MIKKLFLIFSLVLSMGATSVAVNAQDLEGVAAPDIPEVEIEGAEFGYSRTYTVDFMALMEDPEYDPEDMSALMRSISIQGIQFDSEDSASSYIETNIEALDAAQASGDETMEGIEATELEGYDVEGVIVTMDMPDVGIAMTMIVFADGDQVFQISATDADVETTRTTAESLLEYVLDNDVQDEEVTFNEDGTSTGGVFDRMPAGDDELVGELTSVMDMELMPPAAE